MEDVDRVDLLARELGFVLKPEQKEALESLLRGNDVFCVLPTGFGKSLIYQMFVYAKSSSSVQRPTIIVISPLKSIMDEQIASNEFGLSACELRFDCETLTAIRDGDVQVVYAAAEQVLNEKFTTLLRQGDTTFRCSLSLIVVDESHTVYTWGIDSHKQKKSKPFREQYGNLSVLRSFCSGVPVLALTGTVDSKMGKKIRHLLAMKQDVHCITLSPERSNIKFSVIKVKREHYHSNFEWISNMIKTHGLSTPKTIVFCNTMTNVASMVGNLFAMLGNALYVPERPQVHENKLVGIFHSLTLSKYKKRVMDSFKSDIGSVRVVIATSALSMGVNFPDVKYVVHYGPARSSVDHIQEAGRAGRNGEKAYDITIYHGQQLSFCEKGIKDFAKSTSCLRQAIYLPFDSNVKSVVPMHDCCSICERDCKCNGDGCSRIPQLFEHQDKEITTTCTSRFERRVSTEDREALKIALIRIKEQYDSSALSPFDPVSTHGFSSELIEAIVKDCEHCGTLEYLMSTFPLFSKEHAFTILEILHEIFDDIPGIEELMHLTECENLNEEIPPKNLFDIENYFDEPSLGVFEDDWVNVEELENL